MNDNRKAGAAATASGFEKCNIYHCKDTHRASIKQAFPVFLGNWRSGAPVFLNLLLEG